MLAWHQEQPTTLCCCVLWCAGETDRAPHLGRVWSARLVLSRRAAATAPQATSQAASAVSTFGSIRRQMCASMSIWGGQPPFCSSCARGTAALMLTCVWLYGCNAIALTCPPPNSLIHRRTPSLLPALMPLHLIALPHRDTHPCCHLVCGIPSDLTHPAFVATCNLITPVHPGGCRA